MFAPAEMRWYDTIETYDDADLVAPPAASGQRGGDEMLRIMC